VLSATNLFTQLRSAPAVHTSADGTERVYLSVGISHVCIESLAPSFVPKVKWAMNATGALYGTPTISADGARVFFPPSGDATTYARNATTGAALWTQFEGQNVRACFYWTWIYALEDATCMHGMRCVASW
jgi:hypothetical protein